MKTVARTIAIMVLVLACAVAAEAANPTMVGSLSLGTRAHDLVLDSTGNLAYVGTDLGLTIVDISNRAAPVKLASVKVGQVFGMAVRGSNVYLATTASSAGFAVIDVADPIHPFVRASRKISGSARDVALKDNVAYVASFGGEIYLFDISNPNSPRLFKSVGIVAWNTGGDAANLDKLRRGVTGGNGKVTGLSVIGNHLFAVEWNYGRLYYYDVTDAANPIFSGTYASLFSLRVKGDPDRDAVYMMGAFGGKALLYSAPISILDPNTSTRASTCPLCDTFQMTSSDSGGLTVSSNGNYVIYIAGKRGVVQVLDVTNPAAMTDAGSLAIPPHGPKTAEPLGVQTFEDYIFTAAGSLGLLVLSYPGLH